MPASEQARELVAQAGVDALEGVLEARARLLVDAPHGLIERGERGGEVGKLAVEILLALRLFLELIDGGEIDLTEPLDVGARLLQGLLPGRYGGRRVEVGQHLGELATGLRELLGQGRAAHVRLLRREARRVHGLARRAHAPLGRQALLIEGAQRCIGFLERAARYRQFRLHRETQRERVMQACLSLHDRLIARGKLLFQLGTPARELLALLAHAPEAHRHRALGRTARLDPHLQLARRRLCRLRLGARGAEGRAPLLALTAERALALLEFASQCLRARQLGRGPCESLLGRRALVRHRAGVLPQPLAPQARLLGVRAACLEQPDETCVFLVRALQRRLRLLATRFRLRQLRARRGELALRLGELCIGRRGCGTQPLEAMLAPEHPGARLRSPAHPQPVAPHPFAFARDQRASRGERRARPQRIPERFGRRHRGEPRAHRRRTRHVGGERRLEARGGRAATLDQRDLAGGELPERTRHLLQALDAHGLEIVAEDGFDSPLPAALDLECGREPRPRRESGAAQPLPGLSGMVGERRRLQGLERGELGTRLLARRARLLQVLLGGQLGGALCLQMRLGRRERRGELLGGSARLLFLQRQARQLLAALLFAHSVLLGGQALSLRGELPQLIFQLLDARPFHLRGLIRVAHRPGVRLPALLPVLQRLLARLEDRARALLGVLRRLERGREVRDLRAQRLELALIALEVRAQITERGMGLGEIGALALAQFARVLDRLLEARDLGADLVVAALHHRQPLAVCGVRRALLLDRAFRGALLGECALHDELALAHRRIVYLRAAVQIAQAQRQQLRGQTPLLLLQRLVTPRARRLALQVANLLFHLIAHILQPLEILAGLGDARLGLLAPLLVARDTGRLLDEGAHVLALGVDDARDHALLDDGVAARAEPGAQEQVGDVLAPAAHAIDEVRRGVITRHLALERDLAVVGVGAADLAVRVVEQQFHGSRADRLARGRAVEHHVRHVVAAQMLGGQFAHHPAYGVDDVRLAAAVRADDTGEITREADLCWIDEGLEAGKLDLGQPHRRFVRPLKRPRGWCSVEEYAPDAHRAARDLRQPGRRS